MTHHHSVPAVKSAVLKLIKNHMWCYVSSFKHTVEGSAIALCDKWRHLSSWFTCGGHFSLKWSLLCWGLYVRGDLVFWNNQNQLMSVLKTPINHRMSADTSAWSARSLVNVAAVCGMMLLLPPLSHLSDIVITATARSRLLMLIQVQQFCVLLVDCYVVFSQTQKITSTWYWHYMLAISCPAI